LKKFILDITCYINDPRLLVQESFENFLIQKNYKNSKITRENFLEWKFEEHLENLLGNNNFIEKVPYLFELKNYFNMKGQFLKGVLVKLNCMVQNINENQLYMALGTDSQGNLKLNKYLEYETGQNEMLVEDDYSQEENFSNSILCDRIVMNCVNIPGLNPYLKQKLCLNCRFPKNILVLDYSTRTFKINDDVLVLGLAYESNEDIIIHAWKIFPDFISQLSLNCEKSLNSINIVKTDDLLQSRNLISKYLNRIFKNDYLISEYLVLFLTSQIFARVGIHSLGKLNLNIINNFASNEKNSDYIPQLKILFEIITNFCIFLTPTIKSLNKEPLYSRFDANTELLQQGLLQSPKHTFLIIDERHVEEGKLDTIGCKNYNTLKSLIEFGILNYEYPYSNIEMNQEMQILIISDQVKSLFDSFQIISLPYINNQGKDINSQMENLDISENTFSDEEVLQMRMWFNYVRYTECLTKNISFQEEMTNQILNDFKNRKDNFTADNLDICMKLSRLNAISYGRTELSYDDYLYAKNLEQQRIQRMALIKIK
jgi:hypothetical protein